MSRREMNARLRDPITVKSTSSGLSTYYYYTFGFFWIIFYPFPIIKLSSFYLITFPVPTCLVHNCETSRSLVISICCHPCLEIKFPLIPINVTLVTLTFLTFVVNSFLLWSNSAPLQVTPLLLCTVLDSPLMSILKRSMLDELSSIFLWAMC